MKWETRIDILSPNESVLDMRLVFFTGLQDPKKGRKDVVTTLHIPGPM